MSVFFVVASVPGDDSTGVGPMQGHGLPENLRPFDPFDFWSLRAGVRTGDGFSAAIAGRVQANPRPCDASDVWEG